MPDVITLAEQFSSRLDRQDAQELERIIRAYAGIQSRIQGEIDALALEINQGAIPTRAQVLKMARFKRLMAETEAELQKFQSFLGVEIGGMGREYIGKGLHDSQALMAAAVGDEPALVARFRALPPETVERLMGFLDPTGPLYARLELLAPRAAEMFRDAILENIALGRNPKTWAAAVTRALGVGLTDALRMARTVQLYSYREASRANYAANDHIVKGWQWYAKLDGLTCFPAGTLVTTERGQVPIEQVERGEKVLTHTGEWRKVTETMRRAYSDYMVTVYAGGTKITATKDHPLLVERQGKLNWIEIASLKTSDRLVCNPDYLTDVSNHTVGDFTVERGIGNADYLMPPGLEPHGFTGVPVSDRFLVVPISSIHFHYGIESGEKEIHGITPAWETVFLSKFNTEYFKANPEMRFRFRFPSVPPVTAGGTELLFCHSGNDPKLLAASQTCIDDGRAAAFFGTEFPLGITRSKNLSATWTGFVNRIGASALKRAVVVPVGIAPVHTESGAATYTGLSNAGILLAAFERAVFGVFAAGGRFENLTANLAGKFNAWLGNLARFSVGVRSLIIKVALLRAKLSSVSMGADELFTAFDTSLFHEYIVSNSANHYNKEVYNIEVEQDHSYIANGIVVHNCMSCVSQHGKVYPLDKTLNDHHNGRCTMLPVTILTPDGYGYASGETWFNGLSEGEQKAMMGPGKFQAWKNREFDFSALSRENADEVYGMMRTETPLAELTTRTAP